MFCAVGCQNVKICTVWIQNKPQHSLYRLFAWTDFEIVKCRTCPQSLVNVPWKHYLPKTCESKLVDRPTEVDNKVNKILESDVNVPSEEIIVKAKLGNICRGISNMLQWNNCFALLDVRMSKFVQFEIWTNLNIHCIVSLLEPILRLLAPLSERCSSGEVVQWPIPSRPTFSFVCSLQFDW